MASPDKSLATLRPDLAESFEEFDPEADREGFIGHRVMPVVEVESATGKFGKLSIEHLLQTRDTLRAPGGGYSRQQHQFTEDSYITEEHGAEEVIDDNDSKMYQDFFDHELVATKRARDAILRNAEIRIADKLFNTTNFTPTTVTTEWSVLTSSAPITDVEAAVQRLWNTTGIRANALIVNWKVFRNLRNTTQIVDRIKYSGIDDPKAEKITESMLAEVFGIRYVIVAGSPKNTANEGAAVSISPIWSDEYALVTRVSNSADFREPCIGRTMHWSEDGSSIFGTVEEYREEDKRSTIIRVRHQVDEKILYSELGELLDNITV